MSTDEPCIPSPDDPESGQTTVLILGVVMVVLIFAAVLLGITSVTSETRRLLAAADGAASAAAASIQPVGPGAETTSAEVQAAAERHLQEVGAANRHQNLGVAVVQIRDGGQTVYVELTATAELPVLRWVLPAEVALSADSQARVTVNR